MMFGLQMEDPEVKRTAQKIIFISIFLATVALINAITITAKGVTTVFVGGTWGYFGLTILRSACGYFGARNNERCLLCVFSAWSLINCILLILFAIMILIAATVATGLWEYLQVFKVMLIVVAVVLLIAAFIEGLCFAWGNRLYSLLRNGGMMIKPGMVQVVQPGVAQQPMMYVQQPQTQIMMPQQPMVGQPGPQQPMMVQPAPQQPMV